MELKLPESLHSVLVWGRHCRCLRDRDVDAFNGNPITGSSLVDLDFEAAASLHDPELGGFCNDHILLVIEIKVLAHDLDLLPLVESTRDDAPICIEAVFQFVVEQFDYIDAEGSIGIASLQLPLQGHVLGCVLVEALHFCLRASFSVRDLADEYVDEAGHVTKKTP